MFLAPSVHAVRIADDLVLLDVAKDRYLCLPGGAALGLSTDRTGLATCDPDMAEELVSAGLARHTRPERRLAGVAVTAAEADLCRPATEALTWVDHRDFALATFDAAWLYPRRTFGDLVAFAHVRACAHAPDREPSEEMRALVARFHQWSCWIPAPAKCLIRSFVLLRHLRRHGFDARWVFAVRTWPFEAHCWLQTGSVLLDEAPDRLSAYHPILVV